MGEFHLEKQSKMCHCHDNLALRPAVAKKYLQNIVQCPIILLLDLKFDKLYTSIHFSWRSSTKS
ncbi:hypothetical protein JM83_3911 [Gillisia sp. Hel_I_86]|nr:hypothetical protein JM83_3911 [Gillisia sp. Hel_I_86]